MNSKYHTWNFRYNIYLNNSLSAVNKYIGLYWFHRFHLDLGRIAYILFHMHINYKTLLFEQLTVRRDVVMNSTAG